MEGTNYADGDGLPIAESIADGDDALSFPQGAEIGSFALGSTVIALFERPAPFPADWQPDRPVRMGEAMCETAATTPATEPDSPLTSTPS